MFIIQEDLKILNYFKVFNIISFKSFSDSARSKDILDCLIYMTGFVNLEKTANLENTAITPVVNHLPKTFFNRYKSFITQAEKGKYIIDLNLLQVYVLNLSEIELNGLDSDHLLEAGPSERLDDLFNQLKKSPSKSKNIMDELFKFLYNRFTNFEKREFPENFIPKVLKKALKKGNFLPSSKTPKDFYL